MKDIKLLYETSVKKVVEETEISSREENGEKIEVRRIVKKAKPIQVAILKPDRKLFKAAELFHAKTLSSYLQAGLMPYSLVAKRYANDGGVLTDKERARIKELRDEAEKLEAEFYQDISDKEMTEEVKQRKNQVLVRINDINTEVTKISNAYADIYDSTADVKARNDTIEWWILFLLYINEDGKEFKPLFGEGSFEDRMTVLEGFEDKEDPFTMEVIKKLSYLISFWFTARNTVTQIDFNTMEKLYQDSLSNYHVKDEEESVKVSDSTPSVTT